MDDTAPEPPRMRRRPRWQITICVLAVIGLLMLNLVAVILRSVTAMDREEQCGDNLKQIGWAMMQYVQDHDNRYPAGADEAPGRHVDCWASAIYPYLKDKSVYHCPDDPTTSFKSKVPISYAMNWNLMNFKPKSGAYSAAINDDPSSTVLMCEVQGVNSDPADPVAQHDRSVAVTMSPGYWSGNLPGWTGQYATGSAPGEPINVADNKPRHRGRSMYLLTDCHVKLLSAALVSSGYMASSSVNTATVTAASGTGCLDNLPADWGKPGCTHPGTATVTFSPI